MPDKFDPFERDAARTPSAGCPGNAAPSPQARSASDDGPLPWEADPPREDGPLPWDAEPAPADPGAPRQRHDAFTDARKSVLLRALVKTGCILDACRLTGVAPRTVYRHQERDPHFAENCRLAIRMSATPVEITAWQRAVEGVEQEFACGGQVHVRRRYDSSILRLLLQGSNPKKYGARPGFKRKHLLKHERKRMEREIRAELEAAREPERSVDDAIVAIEDKLRAIGIPIRDFGENEDGYFVPPGFALVPLPKSGEPPAEPGPEAGGAVPGEDTPRESM